MNAHQGKTIRAGTIDRVALAGTFAHAALSYWLTVFPRVCVHIARWQRRAQRIPDPVLRRLALAALREKRGNIEGAAAFAAFAPRAQRGKVTRALSAFQAAYNLLDMVGEQPSADPILDGERLHSALLFAIGWPSATGALGELDPGVDALDWYEHHPENQDGGYLDALVGECRSAFKSLPSYGVAAPAARMATERIVAFQSLNLSEAQGDHAGLEQWARAATPAGAGLQWWETAAAAGSSLATHSLIAAAADERFDANDAKVLEDAYFPWIGGLHSLLDNLIDKHEDEAAGHRSLIEYYGPQRAGQRMRWMSEQATGLARELPHSRHHLVILAAMIANYLSAPEAHTPELEPVTQNVLDTVGELERPTMLVFTLRHLPAHLRALCGRAKTHREPEGLPRLDNFR